MNVRWLLDLLKLIRLKNRPVDFEKRHVADYLLLCILFVNMRNNFSPKTRNLFDFGGYCLDWEDGRNDADALHHIFGRESSSPYNAAPLNNFRNHMPEGRKDLPSIHSFDVRSKYLTKTKKHLESIGYIPTQEDLDFINKYKKYYEKIRRTRSF